MLHWLKYSRVPNGVTLYTEESKTVKPFKNDNNLFLSFVFHNDWLSFKSMTLNFVFFVNVLLSICCHNGSGMPNLRIFVEDIVALLGAMTDKWV